jgi:type VI secretion system protein ImpL
LATIIDFFKQKWVLQLLGLIAVSILLFFVGPLIAIGGWTPLAEISTRVISILLLAMCWMVLLFLTYIKAQKTDQQLVEDLSQTDTAAPAEELKIIQERFDEAIEVVKASGSGKNRLGGQYLYELPWYIIIGPPGSGKTTALMNSGLKFPLAERFGKDAIRGVGGTRNCDWWFTDNAVLIDTAGRYTTQDSDAAADASSWQGFLDLLKRHRKRRPINGALIAVSLSDLLTQSEDERRMHASAIRSRIQELNDKLDIRFPIYLLFTKCDLVAGFNEFFSTMGAEERNQVWGTTFNLQMENLKDAPDFNFSQEYDALLGRVNERISFKIYQEHDLARRAQIFGFPQQMANLKGPVEQFLNDVFMPNRFEKTPLLRGFYFTSGTQEGTPIDRLIGSVANSFGLDRNTQPTFSGQGRSYFIHDLFRKVIFPEASLVGTNSKLEKRRHLLQRLAYTGVTLIVALGVALWSISFTRNQQLVNDIDGQASQYQTTINGLAYQQDDITKLLVPLAHLRNATELPPTSVPLLMNAGLYQGDKLQSAAQDAYKRLLSGRFLFSLGIRLESLIEANIDKPELLGLLLKSYLMLGDPAHLKAMEVKALLNVDWSNSVTPLQREQLNKHLDELLQSRFTPLPLNLALVSQAREILTKTSLSEQIYSRIKSEKSAYQAFTLNQLELFGSQADLVLQNRDGNLSQLSISGFYTAAGFQQAFMTAYDSIAETAQQALWVRGIDSEKGDTESQLVIVKDELLNYYVDDYIQVWLQLLNSVEIKQLRDLTSATEILDAASGSFSPIRKVLQALNANTDLVRVNNESKSLLLQSQPDKANGEKAPENVAKPLAKEQLLLSSLMGSTSASQQDAILQRVDDRFGKLSLLARKQGDTAAPIEGLLQELFNLYTFLADLEASGSGSAALEAMKNAGSPGVQLQRKARHLDEPLRSWLNSFSAVSQNAVASSSQNQLGKIWGSDIVPFCKRGIAGRYPLVKTSQQDITFEDFYRFFGSGQMLDEFFNINIKPFVDTSVSPWRFNEGTRPGISSSSLRQFEIATQIRDAFFNNRGNTPLVSFRLKPIQLDSDILRFSLRLGDQAISYQHGPAVSSKLTWPAANGNGTARIQFQSSDGSVSGASEEGAWGWLKLLDKAQLKATNNADKFLLTFDVSGHKAVFELSASSVINPFALSAMKRFQCKKTL